MTLGKDSSSFNPSNPVMPGIVTDTATPIVPTSIPPMELMTITEPIHLSVSESRKRCASELEEHRIVKALKREPQDDAPLISSIQDATVHAVLSPPFSAVPQSVTFTPPSTVAPPSQPPSRPPTPPAFPPATSFVSVKPQAPRTSSYPPFIPPTNAPVLIHSTSMPSPPVAVAPPPFPHSWSDPLPTRHHQSLSSGSVSVPHISQTPLAAPSYSSTIIPTSLPLPPHSVPSNAASSAMTPAVGRMSRSGSISGTNFRNPYSTFPYANDPYSDRATSAWHATSTPPANQSNRYTGAEATSSSRKFSISGHSAPSTTQNSPSDDEDDDEDSDSDDSSSGKTVTQHVRSSLNTYL